MKAILSRCPYFSLDTMGKQQRQLLIDEWERHLQHRENLAPTLEASLQCTTSTVNESTFEFTVDMSDSTSAKELEYYRKNIGNVSFFEQESEMILVSFEVYKNFSVPKGLVLIINNKNFHHGVLNQR